MALGRTLRSGALAVAVVICATSGCGLPDARPVLPSPTDPRSSATAQQFTFAAPEVIAAPFLGIELYYRIVPVESAPARDLESPRELDDDGFLPIASSIDDDPRSLPLIAGPGTGVEVTVDFSGVDIGSEPVATYRHRDGGIRRVTLRRAVRSNDDYKKFACDEFDANDVDIETVAVELADPENCETVQLQLYALSYGTDLFTVYSDALDLGTIDLTFGRR